MDGAVRDDDPFELPRARPFRAVPQHVEEEPAMPEEPPAEIARPPLEEAAVDAEVATAAEQRLDDDEPQIEADAGDREALFDVQQAAVKHDDGDDDDDEDDDVDEDANIIPAAGERRATRKRNGKKARSSSRRSSMRRDGAWSTWTWSSLLELTLRPTLPPLPPCARAALLVLSAPLLGAAVVGVAWTLYTPEQPPPPPPPPPPPQPSPPPPAPPPPMPPWWPSPPPSPCPPPPPPPWPLTPPPPLPPSLPSPLAPSAADTVAVLNARFRSGGPEARSDALHDVGVLISQFDELSRPAKPWLFVETPSYAQYADRRSATLVYASMPHGTGGWSASGQIPLFGTALVGDERDDVGGFVLAPEAFSGEGGVLCGYPYDPHTFNYRCEPPGLSESCVPGCCCGGSSGAPEWVRGFIGAHAYFQDAYRPTALRDMLADFGKRPSQGGRGYNEIVVGEARWHTRLPHSFEAFFYPLTSNCRRRPECEAHTRAVHADFLRDYPGSAVPLLSLDPSNWEAPFAVATDP